MYFLILMILITGTDSLAQEIAPCSQKQQGPVVVTSSDCAQCLSFIKTLSDQNLYRTQLAFTDQDPLKLQRYLRKHKIDPAFSFCQLSNNHPLRRKTKYTPTSYWIENSQTQTLNTETFIKRLEKL